MAVAGELSAEQAISSAKRAVAALRSAADGKAADQATETNAGTLSSLADVMDGLLAEVDRLRRGLERKDGGLRRIANLEVRSARGLIEASRWKDLTAEVQALASSLQQDGPAPPSAPRTTW